MATAPQQNIPSSPLVAQPVFQTDATGAPITSGNPLPVSATVTPAANQRVNAQAGDFVDGAITTLGLEADSNTTNTVMGRLTKIRDLLNGVLGTQQADLTTTGTISAAQAVINTPVSNATVVLALAQGQSSWKALLANGGGGFTSGTTLVADKSIDGGTTWVASSFKVAGALSTTTVQSVVGPGPLEISGNAAGVSHVRIRCSVLNSTETIAVTLRAGAGISEIGLISSIPAGSNLMGGVNVVDSAGTNKLAVDGSGRVTEASAATIATNTTGLATQTTLAAAKTDLDTIVTNTASLSTIATNTGTPLVTATATKTNVNAAASNTALLASNSSRKGALFFNDSTAILYLSYGSGAATTTAYTVQVPPNSLFELPPMPVFTGAIQGIWAAANGAVRITELS